MSGIRFQQLRNANKEGREMRTRKRREENEGKIGERKIRKVFLRGFFRGAVAN